MHGQRNKKKYITPVSTNSNALHTKSQFTCHKEHSLLPLSRTGGECCIQIKRFCVVRIMWNVWFRCVEKRRVLLRSVWSNKGNGSYSTTNKMHVFLKLFILVKRSTCFGRSFRPSSGAQDCTYGNRHMSNSCCYLPLASPLAAALWHMPAAVCAVLSSWWWTERPSETCRAFYKNK